MIGELCCPKFLAASSIRDDAVWEVEGPATAIGLDPWAEVEQVDVVSMD